MTLFPVFELHFKMGHFQDDNRRQLTSASKQNEKVVISGPENEVNFPLQIEFNSGRLQ